MAGLSAFSRLKDDQVVPVYDFPLVRRAQFSREVAGGPAELSTGLPTEEIKSALDSASIACGYSDDPGRYVCNNLFYRIMTESAGTNRVSGFVHLPYIHTVDDEARVQLKRVVTEVVKASVAKQRSL